MTYLWYGMGLHIASYAAVYVYMLYNFHIIIVKNISFVDFSYIVGCMKIYPILKLRCFMCIYMYSWLCPVFLEHDLWPWCYGFVYYRCQDYILINDSSTDLIEICGNYSSNAETDMASFVQSSSMKVSFRTSERGRFTGFQMLVACFNPAQCDLEGKHKLSLELS